MGSSGLAEANVDLRAPSIGWFVVSRVITIVAMIRQTIPDVTIHGVQLTILARIKLAIGGLAPA